MHVLWYILGAADTHKYTHTNLSGNCIYFLFLFSDFLQHLQHYCSVQLPDLRCPINNSG